MLVLVKLDSNTNIAKAYYRNIAGSLEITLCQCVLVASAGYRLFALGSRHEKVDEGFFIYNHTLYHY